MRTTPVLLQAHRVEAVNEQSRRRPSKRLSVRESLKIVWLHWQEERCKSTSRLQKSKCQKARRNPASRLYGSFPCPNSRPCGNEAALGSTDRRHRVSAGIVVSALMRCRARISQAKKK